MEAWFKSLMQWSFAKTFMISVSSSSAFITRRNDRRLKPSSNHKSFYDLYRVHHRSSPVVLGKLAEKQLHHAKYVQYVLVLPFSSVDQASDSNWMLLEQDIVRPLLSECSLINDKYIIAMSCENDLVNIIYYESIILAIRSETTVNIGISYVTSIAAQLQWSENKSYNGKLIKQ